MKKYLICFLCVFAVIPILATENSADNDASSKNNYNILMIVLDACRPDHLGCYGYKLPTSPNIDKLAAESILFEQAYSQGIQTFVSFSSFLTGKYPITLNAYWEGKRQTPLFLPFQQEELTLAEIIRTHNYSTVAFPTGLHTMPKFGLSQGFQIYTNNPDFDFSQKEGVDYEFVRAIERDGQPITSPIWSFQYTLPLAISYLKITHNAPFFLLVHTNDTHQPSDVPLEFSHKFDPDYTGPVCNNARLTINLRGIKATKITTADKTETTLSNNDLNHIIAHYDGGVAYADYGVGQILKQLSESGLDQNTIVVLLADHGDGLGERGYFGRGFDPDTHLRLSEELCRVPLIIRLPTALKSALRTPQSSLRINTPVQLIDLMPTLLDFLGIKPPADIDGISLKELMLNNAPLPKERPIITEIRPDHLSSRIGDWKLCYAERPTALFNLKSDPAEKTNLINKPEAKKIQESLIKKLNDWQKEHLAKRGDWIKDTAPNTSQDKKPPAPEAPPAPPAPPPPPPAPNTPK